MTCPGGKLCKRAWDGLESVFMIWISSVEIKRRGGSVHLGLKGLQAVLK